jgi:tight adherence protein C
MFFITILILIFGLTLGAALLLTKLYVRPKEAMERVVGGIDQVDVAPSHPSLAFHDLIKKLGNVIPQSPKDVTVMQRRLIRAGMRSENSLKILYGSKVALGVALPVLAVLVVAGTSAESGNKFAIVLGAAASASTKSRADCPTRSTCWWYASRADSDWTRRSCRSPRNWRMRIRKSARNSAWSISN